MSFASRAPLTLLITIVLTAALAGCGGSGADDAAAPSNAGQPEPTADTGVTDGRTGPAVTASDSEAPRELAPGGRSDGSDPRRSDGRTDGIGAGDSCPQVELAPTSANLSQIEATTLCLLNGVRADDGLRPLALNADLARAALAHSADMVAHSYFAHEGRNGSQVQERIGATGYLPKNAGWTVGENLAWGTGALATPKAIVNAWMNSKGHRDNILKPSYRDIGFGTVAGNPAAADGDGATYATEFGVRGTATAPSSSVAKKTQARKAAAARAKARRAKARLASARRASARRAAAR